MSNRELSDNFWMKMFFGLIGGALIAGILVYILFQEFEVSVQTTCRIDGVFPAHTIILIDQSDPFSNNDIDWVKELINQETLQIEKYGKLTLMTLSAKTPHEPKEMIYACSPGRPDSSLGIIDNPEMIENEWRLKLFNPIFEASKKIIASKTKQKSPISEALFAIADRADFQPSIAKRKIIIVSDLIQNSNAYSFYKKGASWEKFYTSLFANELPDFTDVTIVTRIVPRHRYDIPMKKLRKFWDQYFLKTNAIIETIN